MNLQLFNENCLETLKRFPENSVDSVVTDPPYGLGKEPDVVEVMKSWIETGFHEVKGSGFMGKEWDAFVPQPLIWKEVLRVLKPGGHILCFSGTRTVDWMGMSLRFAGFQLKDQLVWCYGSGFPKSVNIGKAVDSLQGNEREVLGTYQDVYKHDNSIRTKEVTENQRPYHSDNTKGGKNSYLLDVTKGNTEWEGWGTALKPAIEPIILARKPLSEKTIVENVLRWGTGGINIDDCRIELQDDEEIGRDNTNIKNSPLNPKEGWNPNSMKGLNTIGLNKGRYPSNFIHDGSEEVLKNFPYSKSGGTRENGENVSLKKINPSWRFASKNIIKNNNILPNEGSVSRFFYCAKPSEKERILGLERNEKENFHPTVKPLELMKYLIKLVTPKNGIVLDPFMGSGTTGVACKFEDFGFIGIELMPEYFQLAETRIKNSIKEDDYDYLF